MSENPLPPQVIREDEKLVRLIFSPFHLNKARTRLTPNAFRPPPGRDEVSLLRLHFTNADFCRQQGKKMEADDQEKGGIKEFEGFGLVLYSEILTAQADVKASPLPHNPFHADLFFGCVFQRGEPLPAELNEKTKRLSDIARFYADPEKDAESWKGQELN